MKKLILIVFAIVLAGAVQAQNWEHDLETAKTKAKQEGKNILLVPPLDKYHNVQMASLGW